MLNIYHVKPVTEDKFSMKSFHVTMLLARLYMRNFDNFFNDKFTAIRYK